MMFISFMENPFPLRIRLFIRPWSQLTTLVLRYIKIFSWYFYHIYIWATLLYLHVSANLRDIVRSTTKYLQEVTTTTHCATSRKVVDSVPDGVIGIFHLHNPSGRTMALGLTQPLTEMSTRIVSWVYRRPVLRADNLTTFMCRLSWNLGASFSWNPQGLSRPVMGLLYLLPQNFRQIDR
jgi:hypothetical protein